MALIVNNIFPGELHPNTTIGGCIDIFENVWPEPQKTIDALENEVNNTIKSGVYWKRAETIGNGAYQRIRTNQMMEITHLAHVVDNSLCQNVHNQFNLVLLAASNPYVIRYQLKERIWHEGYSLLKYSEGEQYYGHYDGGTNTGRSISAILYLNDDYEGGELEFPHFNIKIKPQAGMLILFPSNFAYYHIAHPVIKGTKYALVTWLKDREM